MLLDRLRGWLGWCESSGEHAAAAGSPPIGIATGEDDVFAAIRAFLVRHTLPLDSETLAFAHDCVTAADPSLPGLVRRRLRSGQPITCEWIDEIRGVKSGEDSKSLSDLRMRLEKSVGEFSQTTRDARSATNDYRSALRGHVDGLDAATDASSKLLELAEVARAMLERTQEIEQQMARSERETRQLQRRLDEARRNAEMDHLTGLPNRRAFEALLISELADANQSRDPLCVAFCDIDKFKAINDTHGHEAGDRVLKIVARSLAEISDDRCHVARHGGEEFVVLFRGKSIRDAFETLDATRDNLSARRLVNRATETPFGQVSFSAGIADLFAYPDPRTALKAADDALYSAKDQGRNRIVIATPGQVERAAA